MGEPEYGPPSGGGQFSGLSKLELAFGWRQGQEPRTDEGGFAWSGRAARLG